jgi:hypothetical protein
MKPVLALVLLTLFAPLAASEPTVDVTLVVDLGAPATPDYATCALVVPEEANVGDVLDQAVATGCIDEWSSASFPGFGRYVTSIDNVQEAVVTYWAFRVNGEYSSSGIDATLALEGDVFQFTYEQWPVPLPAL